MTNQSVVPNQEPAPESARSLSLLASEMFGRDFHGEVKQPEAPVAEPAIEEPSPVEGVTEPNEDHGADEAPNDEGDGNTISSLSELIEHLEADPEWIDGLKVSVKVDGKPAETTLKDLVANYQMNVAADKRLEEAKSKAKALTQELTHKSEAIQAQFVASAKLIERAESLLSSETKSIDWNALRRDDPAEYSAKKAEIAERRQEIDKLKNDALVSYQKTQEGTSQLMQAEYQKHLQQEQESLLEKLPEWRDPDKATAEKTRMVSYLSNQGFSEQDVMGASDHRLILLAHKAMLYDEGMSSADAAKKKVAKVPKVMKPGTSQAKPQDQQAREQAQKLNERLRSSGRIEDAAALLRAKRGLK